MVLQSARCRQSPAAIVAGNVARLPARAFDFAPREFVSIPLWRTPPGVPCRQSCRRFARARSYREPGANESEVLNAGSGGSREQAPRPKLRGVGVVDFTQACYIGHQEKTAS
jgi:hypothetical protein